MDVDVEAESSTREQLSSTDQTGQFVEVDAAVTNGPDHSNLEGRSDDMDPDTDVDLFGALEVRLPRTLRKQ